MLERDAGLADRDGCLAGAEPGRADQDVIRSDPDIGVGEIEETLKWGEPAYLTRSGSGSTIRLGRDRASGAAAIHFICHTRLVDDFRRLYPAGLRYAGDRSILLGDDGAGDEAALRHCIALALTYHARKKGARAAA